MSTLPARLSHKKDSKPRLGKMHATLSVKIAINTLSAASVSPDTDPCFPACSVQSPSLASQGPTQCTTCTDGHTRELSPGVCCPCTQRTTCPHTAHVVCPRCMMQFAPAPLAPPPQTPCSSPPHTMTPAPRLVVRPRTLRMLSLFSCPTCTSWWFHKKPAFFPGQGTSALTIV